MPTIQVRILRAEMKKIEPSATTAGSREYCTVSTRNYGTLKGLVEKIESLFGYHVKRRRGSLEPDVDVLGPKWNPVWRIEVQPAPPPGFRPVRKEVSA